MTNTYTCPHCGAAVAPVRQSAMTSAGIVIMIVLLVLCIVLAWVPIVAMRYTYSVCPVCGWRVS